jgi:hypothetical protein
MRMLKRILVAHDTLRRRKQLALGALVVAELVKVVIALALADNLGCKLGVDVSGDKEVTDVVVKRGIEEVAGHEERDVVAAVQKEAHEHTKDSPAPLKTPRFCC